MNSNGVPNMGALDLPRYAEVKVKAYLRSGLDSSTWEQWIISDNGRSIRSIFTVHERGGGSPTVRIGTFIKPRS